MEQQIIYCDYFIYFYYMTHDNDASKIRLCFVLYTLSRQNGGVQSEAKVAMLG